MTAIGAQQVARRVHGAAPAETTAPRFTGPGTRTIPFVVDAAIVNGVAAVTAAAVVLVLSLFPISHDLRTVLVAIGGAAFFVWVVAYFATFWATTGQPPGNRVMRIRVTRPAGGR